MDFEPAFVFTILLEIAAVLITVIICAPVGAAIAFHAKKSIGYSLVLFLCLLPFLVGSSVWAYLATIAAEQLAIRSLLLSTSTWVRCLVLIVLIVARTLPFGVFFVATSLHSHVRSQAGYFRANGLGRRYYILTALRHIPLGILFMIGMFSGAVFTTEAALPDLLFRANPGTQPETANLALFRMEGRLFLSDAENSLMRAGTLGIGFAAVACLTAGTASSLCIFLLRYASRYMLSRFTSHNSLWASLCVSAGVGVCCLPGVSALAIGGALILTSDVLTASTLNQMIRFRDVIIVGVVCGFLAVVPSIALATHARRRQCSQCTGDQHESILAIWNRIPLLFPAFVPCVAVIFLVSTVSRGVVSDVSQFLLLVVCSLFINCPFVYFVSRLLIDIVPSRNIDWQLKSGMPLLFTFLVDGLLRNGPALISLIGVCAVLIVNDGSITRWFSSVIESPDEVLRGAVLGRATDVSQAAQVVFSSVSFGAAFSAVLTYAFLKSLGGQDG